MRTFFTPESKDELVFRASGHGSVSRTVYSSSGHGSVSRRGLIHEIFESARYTELLDAEKLRKFDPNAAVNGNRQRFTSTMSKQKQSAPTLPLQAETLENIFTPRNE